MNYLYFRKINLFIVVLVLTVSIVTLNSKNVYSETKTSTEGSIIDVSYYDSAKLVALKYSLVLQMNDKQSFKVAYNGLHDYMDSVLFDSIFETKAFDSISKTVGVTATINDIVGTYNKTGYENRDITFKMSVTIGTTNVIYLIQVVNNKIFSVVCL